MKINIIIDFSKLDEADVEQFKKLAIKAQAYPLAAELHNYQKHCAAVLEINNNQVK